MSYGMFCSLYHSLFFGFHFAIASVVSGPSRHCRRDVTFCVYEICQHVSTLPTKQRNASNGIIIIAIQRSFDRVNVVLDVNSSEQSERCLLTTKSKNREANLSQNLLQAIERNHFSASEQYTRKQQLFRNKFESIESIRKRRA